MGSFGIDIETKSIMILLYILLSLIAALIDGSPHWENLDCEPGHKYLFSEMKLNWVDAQAECSMYGAYLLHIDSLKEQNCLLRHAHNNSDNGFEDTFFHDGNDIGGQGIWTHAYDGQEMEYIHWYWGTVGSTSDNVLVVSMTNNQYAGMWDDVTETATYKYICEGLHMV